MRICLISEYFYPDNTGGTGTVLSNLARHLQDEYPDVEIDVITSKNQYRGDKIKLSSKEDWKGIKIRRLNTPRSNRPSSALRLLAGQVFTIAVFRKLLLSRRYDLLFIVTSPPMVPMAARAFQALRRTPYVYLIHDLYPNVATALGVLSEESRVGQLLGRAQRRWLHSARKVVVLGYCMRDYLVEHYTLPPERVEVITNWADAGEIVPLAKTTRFREKHGIEGKVVLYAGNFGQYQNFDNILDAAKLLADNPAHVPGQPDGITFVLVGEGARKEYIARRVQDESISNIRMFPFVDRADLGDLLASSDISLVTLEPGVEGLGVPSKFYNILASGRPTVAIVGEHSEVARALAEADCGVRVDQGQPDQLARTLSDLVASPQELQRLGDNARSIFEEKYTLHHVSEKYHEVFQETVSKSRKPQSVRTQRKAPEKVTE